MAPPQSRFYKTQLLKKLLNLLTMIKKTKISAKEQKAIRKNCGNYSQDYLIKAINEHMRYLKKATIDVENGQLIAHDMLQDLAFKLVIRTGIFDQDKNAYWIDGRGCYYVKI